MRPRERRWVPPPLVVRVVCVDFPGPLYRLKDLSCGGSPLAVRPSQLGVGQNSETFMCDNLNTAEPVLIFRTGQGSRREFSDDVTLVLESVIRDG